MRQKNFRKLWFSFLFLTLGVCVLVYPLVGNYRSDQALSKKIEAYYDTVRECETEELQSIMQEVQSYNEQLLQEGASEISYDELLQASELLGYIEIPKIGVCLPIYRGVGEDVLQKGIGHLTETSLPAGGASTHCVLSGHSGLPIAKFFTDLDQLVEGDVFYLHVLDQVLVYEVDQIKVVLPEETEDIRIVEGEDYTTLVTCTPFGVNSHRLLVRGRRSSAQKGQTISLQVKAEPQAKPEVRTEKKIWYLFIAVSIVLQQIVFWKLVLLFT